MDVKAIGEKIKRKRTALGMTQKQLAQLLSVSNQLVSKWENGESVPSLEYLDSLCRALEVGYSYLRVTIIRGRRTARDGQRTAHGRSAINCRRKMRNP